MENNLDLMQSEHYADQTGELSTYDPPTQDMSDLGCAAALVVQGFNIVRIRRVSPSKVMFEFQDTQEVDDAINAYYGSFCAVDARAFWNVVRDLKSRIKTIL